MAKLALSWWVLKNRKKSFAQKILSAIFVIAYIGYINLALALPQTGNEPCTNPNTTKIDNISENCKFCHPIVSKL
jgi:hypothetical protein